MSKNSVKVWKKFVETSALKRPVVFIIDELDRCRPNYAVSVLEQMKHLFSVPGIVFVLSIDKEELGNAIRGAYGSENINANEYLRRFIDLEYSIPKPATKDFIKYMVDYLRFDEVLFTGERMQYQRPQTEKDEFIEFAIILFDTSNMTLRQIEKILAHAKVILHTFNYNQNLLQHSFLLLVYLYHYKYRIIQNVKDGQIGLQDFLDTIEGLFLQKTNDNNRRIIMFAVCQVLTLYFNYLITKQRNLNLLYSDEGTEEQKATVISKLGKTNEDFIQFLETHKRLNWDIMYLIDKISLTVPFTEDINSEDSVKHKTREFH